jgi:hypothetical protein
MFQSSRKAKYLLTLALVLTSSLAMAATDRVSAAGALNIGYGQPPTNSFCRLTPHSTQQLINQCRTNPEVMDRYTRHFAMTESELIAYFSTLTLGELQQDTEFTVYGVPRNGKLHFHRWVLKKGEKVFFDPSGHAILQMRCGNPLTLGPRNPIALSETPEPVYANADLASLQPIGGESEATPAEITPAAPETPDAIAAPAPAPAPAVVSHGNSCGGVFAAVIVVGGAAACVDHHHHHNPSVPEPASMTGIIIGLGAFVAKRRKN